MASLTLSDVEARAYRHSTDTQVGITVTPKRAMCGCCLRMRNADTGKFSAGGFTCHFCLKNSNPRQPEMKNPAVGGPGRPGGVLCKREES